MLRDEKFTSVSDMLAVMSLPVAGSRHRIIVALLALVVAAYVAVKLYNRYTTSDGS